MITISRLYDDYDAAARAANQQARAGIHIAVTLFGQHAHVDFVAVELFHGDGHVVLVGEQRLVLGGHVGRFDGLELAEFGERREEGRGDRREVQHGRAEGRRVGFQAGYLLSAGKARSARAAVARPGWPGYIAEPSWLGVVLRLTTQVIEL